MDDNNLVVQSAQTPSDEVVRKRIRWAEASKQRRRDPAIRERMRMKNLIATRLRRQNPVIREKERERNRIAMRLKRQNPEFRERERRAVTMRKKNIETGEGMPHVLQEDLVSALHDYRCYMTMGVQGQQLINVREGIEETSRFYSTEASEMLEMEMRVEEEDEDDPDAVDSDSEVPEESQEEELPAPVAITVVPFGETVIKQEVDGYPTATEDATSLHEEVDIKEEEAVEHEEEPEMILPLTPEEMKIEKENNSQNENEEIIIVETCLPLFKPTKDEKKSTTVEQATPSGSTEGVDGGDDNSEDEILPEAAMVVVPGRGDDDPEDFVEENIAVKPVLQNSKRQKTASKRVDTVYRCPNCSLCYTSPEYLAGHVRRGCRYRPTPIKNAYRCITCGEGFSNYGDLYQHKRQKHDADKKGNQTRNNGRNLQKN